MVALNLILSGEKKENEDVAQRIPQIRISFLNVDILDNESIMLKSLTGKKLGIWVAHGKESFLYLKAKINTKSQ